MDAGVVGYIAFLEGKRVIYYGETGDQHVEWFPGAGPETEERVVCNEHGGVRGDGGLSE